MASRATSTPEPAYDAPMEELSIDDFFSFPPYDELFFKINTAEFLNTQRKEESHKNFTMYNIGVSTKPKIQLKFPSDANGK